MKKVMISLLALLLLAAHVQGKEPLAVLVVGVDSWMLGDVIAHIVGAELNRSKKYAVVTRDKLVQTKLKEFRRASEVKLCNVRAWAKANGLSAVCLVKGLPGEYGTFSLSNASQRYSAQLIDVAGNSVSCSADFTFNHAGSPKEMTAVELNKVAWEVVGRLQSSSCKPPSYIRCVDFEPEMVFVEGGTFTMGCTSCREEYSGPTTCRTHSKTTSSVTLSPFWIGKYELKQSEWNNALIAMDTTIQSVYFESVFGKEDDFPAYNIDYNAAQAFIAKLNEHTGKNYRLPTEAEWEYAARGGALSKGYEYSGSNTLDNVSWYSDNSKGKAHVVGTKDGNELGIYDMSGNVWEWCQDWYNDNLPSGTNPTAPRQRPPIYADDYYIIRGGSWYNVACNSHVAYRGYYRPGVQLIGIRLVLPSLP